MMALINSFLLLFQEAAESATHHAEPAAEKASEGWLVEQANHLFGGIALGLERAIMPSIYGLFGAHWHEPAGDESIPAHVVMAIIAFVICVVLVLALRGKLSVERPSKGQQLLEVIVQQIRALLDQVVGPYGKRYIAMVGVFALFILVGNLMGL